MSKIRNPLKWHGGKSRMTKWIIDKMPRHLHYVEPFAGGLAVLLAKDPSDKRHEWAITPKGQGKSEVVNDLNKSLINFWVVLQDELLFSQFKRRVEVTPFSQFDWENSSDKIYPESSASVEAAVNFFVKCRQSWAANFKSFAALSRNRTRRGMNEQAAAWLNCIEGLPEVHNRLRRVVILHDDAVNVIKKQDGPATLFYLDPPYVHDTRVSSEAYQYEMSDNDHRRLLETIKACKGKVMLSGYRSKLYAKYLSDWTLHEEIVFNNVSSASSKPPEIECLWCNF